MASSERPGDGEGAVIEAGGGRVRAAISPEPLVPEAVRARVSTPGAGAVVLFVGTVRRGNRGREVAELAYEAYAEMAAEEMARVASEAWERFGLERVDVVHRVGRLAPGDMAVAVGASAEHRDAAFEATRWAMKELKRRAPIWKRESYVDGSSEWLGEEGPGDRPSPTNGAGEGRGAGDGEEGGRDRRGTREKGEKVR